MAVESIFLVDHIAAAGICLCLSQAAITIHEVVSVCLHPGNDDASVYVVVFFFLLVHTPIKIYSK